MILGVLGQNWGGPRDPRNPGFPGISGEIRGPGAPGGPGGPKSVILGLRRPRGGPRGVPGGSGGGPDPGSGICNPCPVFGGFRGAAALLINVFFGQVLVCFSVRGGVARVWRIWAKSGVFGEFREFRGNPGFRGIWRFWDVGRILSWFLILTSLIHKFIRHF